MEDSKHRPYPPLEEFPKDLSTALSTSHMNSETICYVCLIFLYLILDFGQTGKFSTVVSREAMMYTYMNA